MNTPAHLLFGAAAFAKPGARAVTAAALIGAIAPDLSLYLMAGTSLFILGISPQVVFNELYFSDAWQLVFAIDNSFFLWGIGLVWAIWAKRPAVIAFAGAGMLHLLLDFPLHHDDGRMHFWPISQWVFESPVSYWDHRHFGREVGALEMAASVTCLVILWRRFKEWRMRALFAVLLAMEAASNSMWSFIF